MLQFEELRLKLQGMEPELRELKQSLNIDKLGIEIAELERKAAEPSFWDDMENSQKVLQRTAQLKASVETYNKLQSLYEDTLTLIELAEEAGKRVRGSRRRYRAAADPHGGGASDHPAHRGI